MKTVSRILIAFLALGVGLVSLRYLNFEVQGVLFSKAKTLLENNIYRTVFYLHVVFGVMALLAGPWQFFPKLRNRRLSFHRNLGKVYIVACLTGGLAGLIIALFATGGIISTLGFSGLALGWLITTSMAYVRIRQKNIDEHYRWMVRSFALTFAAVTLRIWLPMFTSGFGWEFVPSYRFISWFCWVPNLLFAEFVILRNRSIVNLTRQEMSA